MPAIILHAADKETKVLERAEQFVQDHMPVR